jgi:alpha-glucosidase
VIVHYELRINFMPQYFGQLHTTEPSWTNLGTVQAIEKSDRHILFHCGDPCLKISVIAANLIRVRVTPTGEFLQRRSWAVTQEDEQWQVVEFEVKEQADIVEITTQQLRVVVHRHPCRVECFDLTGKPFAEDVNQGVGWRKGAIAGWKKIADEEHFYGFGERTGLLDQIATTRTNWTLDALDYDVLTDNMYQAIPFFMALRPGLGYGIFFNTTFWSQFDIGVQQPGVWRMETQGGELDYYIYPVNWKDVLTSKMVTGLSSMSLEL